MQAFTTLTSSLLPLDRSNVDTDAIIPKQYLKSIKRSGFGPYLFDAWRYLDPGEADQPCTDRRVNPDFVLNDPQYQGAKILLARENFGCGSSREHAVWALMDQGFRVVISPSFADIFESNCFKNGLLAITLSADHVEQFFKAVNEDANYELSIDLQAQTVSGESTGEIGFEIDAFRKHCLLNGLDEIGLTLEHADKIKAYEAQRAVREPWLFDLG